MTAFGLMVDMEWCSGCHSCEVACQMEHGLPVGETGIKLCEIGPWEYGNEGKWQFSYVPVITDQCDGCAERTEAGKVPTCVHHCQAKCMEYGPVNELAGQMEPGSKKVLFAL